jgi:hypothetical protein
VKPIVALVADLIFGSKITATAEALGIPVRIVRTAADVRDAAPAAGAVLLDLMTDADEALVRELKAAHLPVIAFLPHVEVERATQIRAAGADRVLPRSKFSAELPKILSELAAPGA